MNQELPISANTPTLRLAMRVEGEWWNAYCARMGSMHDAILLGSIHMNLVGNPDTKAAFMDLMQRCMADLVRATGSNVLGWNDPQRATESERAGRA